MVTWGAERGRGLFIWSQKNLPRVFRAGFVRIVSFSFVAGGPHNVAKLHGGGVQAARPQSIACFFGGVVRVAKVCCLRVCLGKIRARSELTNAGAPLLKYPLCLKGTYYKTLAAVHESGFGSEDRN